MANGMISRIQRVEDSNKKLVIPSDQSLTVELRYTSTYIISNISNASNLFCLVQTGNNFCRLTDLIPSVGFEITSESLNVIIKNKTKYELTIAIMRFSETF